MNKRYETILADLKARQLAGEHLPCPRCGEFTMKPALHTNARSRHADIYICDICSLCEEVLQFMNAPKPLNSWVCLQPERPASDFIARSSHDVLSEVIRTQVPILMDIYKRLSCGELDSEDAQFEAYSQCPGLTALWLNPFHAKYETADGYILIRFRRCGEEIEYCTSEFTK